MGLITLLIHLIHLWEWRIGWSIAGMWQVLHEHVTKRFGDLHSRTTQQGSRPLADPHEDIVVTVENEDALRVEFALLQKACTRRVVQLTQIDCTRSWLSHLLLRIFLEIEKSGTD